MNWSRSSRLEAWRRLHEAAPPAWVLGHAAAVEGLAVAMAEAARDRGHQVDVNLVCVAAVLHDIGRSITQDVRHASVGADLLRAAGVDEQVVRCVERHTGAGITAEEARRLGLPPRDYIPQTIEERIVAHADNLHSGPERLAIGEVVVKYERKGLEQAARRIEALHTEVQALVGVPLDELAAAPLEPVPAP